MAGWTSVLILVALNFTNNTNDYEGHVANVWLSVIASLMAIALIIHTKRKRTPWRY